MAFLLIFHMQILLLCVVTDIRKENRKRIFTLETCPVMIQSILHFDILSSILCFTNSMIAKSLSYYHLYAYKVTFNVCTAYVNIIKRLSHKRISYYTFKRAYWICTVLESFQPWINKRKWNLQDLSIKGHFAYRLSNSDWRYSKLFVKLNQTINY